MNQILFVGLGGFLGSVLRFVSGTLIGRFYGDSLFPLATLMANLLGCFLAGVLMGTIERFPIAPIDMRLFLMTGVLGGFTTFAAFGYESIYLLRRGELLMLASNVLLSVGAGLFLVWFGLWIVEKLF
ncbi:MAG: fluoride efflux transporter CrcB [Bdellovibrionales bacterium]|nr:fluoride efflux transporter CrcB [Bdellovibrionales bacterium]